MPKRSDPLAALEPDRAEGGGPRLQLLLWAAAALAACLFLAWALSRERDEPVPPSGFAIGNAEAGARLFAAEASCANCHSFNGLGSPPALDLGNARLREAGVAGFVSSMWNHAPRMWEMLRKRGAALRSFTSDELAHLFAFLYTATSFGEPGDPASGRRLFERKHCSRCHGSDLAGGGAADNPIRWAQAMWNHAPAMQSRMKKAGLEAVRFDGSEMTHILAYVREISPGAARSRELPPASPERGWRVFRAKCMACHPVKGRGARRAPDLGPESRLPLALPQFAALMWNHSAGMQQGASEAAPRPAFEGQEIADLLSFLSNMVYTEPAGSPQIGKTVFAERGCSRCHGPDARGAAMGPRLRGRGAATSLTLSKALWERGPAMYARAQAAGLAWPEMAPGDVGDLLAFLNTAPAE